MSLKMFPKLFVGSRDNASVINSNTYVDCSKVALKKGFVAWYVLLLAHDFTYGPKRGMSLGMR